MHCPTKLPALRALLNRVPPTFTCDYTRIASAILLIVLCRRIQLTVFADSQSIIQCSLLYRYGRSLFFLFVVYTIPRQCDIRKYNAKMRPNGVMVLACINLNVLTSSDRILWRQGFVVCYVCAYMSLPNLYVR